MEQWEIKNIDAQSIVSVPLPTISKSYQAVLDRSFDTPGHGKDVVDGFNTVHKRYLATFLRMLSTPEVDNIDSKRMHVDDMTDKGEVSFAK